MSASVTATSSPESSIGAATPKITAEEENLQLREELKTLTENYNTLHEKYLRSTKIRDRLESLSKELQKQTEEIKQESASRIQQAEQQGFKLAQEVSGNMGALDKVNENLASITDESHKIKNDNESLVEQISAIKTYYDERDKKLTADLSEANKSLLKKQAILAQLRLQKAHEKERVYAEMQKIANSLVTSRKQMKEAKDQELQLRLVIQQYDEKFVELQSELKNTNLSYGSFKDDMEQVGKRTKELEEETKKWQDKWEESNRELIQMTKDHELLQNKLTKVHDSLVTVTSLYKALEKERADLFKQLGAPLSDDKKNDAENNAEKP